jgi:hypothetical protein
LEGKDSLQNDLRILAALSLSLSRVVGQNASDPILFESLLTGAPTENCQYSFQGQRTIHYSRLSAQPQALSKPFLLPLFVLSQVGRIDATFCIAARSYASGSWWCRQAQVQPVRGFVRMMAGKQLTMTPILRRRLAVALRYPTKAGLHLLSTSIERSDGVNRSS